MAQANVAGVTRESLRDGSFLQSIRASAPAGMNLLTEQQLDDSLASTMVMHPPGPDVYLFGYGSLMWNPAIQFADRHAAKVRGWGRKFCLWLRMGRGSEAEPGLMLGLDKGSPRVSCTGLVFRIPAESAREELKLVWRREMFSGAYMPTWVEATIGDRVVMALTFVVNQAHPRYVSNLNNADSATYIATGRGAMGTCLSYFQNTLESIRELGVFDDELESIARHVVAREANAVSAFSAA